MNVEGKFVITDIVGLGKAAEKVTPVAMMVLDMIQSDVSKATNPATLYLETVSKGAADRHVALADAKAYRELETRSPAVLEAMRKRLLGIEYRRRENIEAAEKTAVEMALENPTDKASDISEADREMRVGAEARP